MQTHIYYFSGTGNTIHVAKELEKRLANVTLKPIISELKKEKEIRTEAEVVGILFPIHAHTFPLVVEKFLKRIDCTSAKYVFAISSRLCASKVFTSMNRILKKKGRILDASFAVNTPINYIPIFSVPKPDEIAKIEEDLQTKLDSIQRIITNQETFHLNTGFLVFILANTLLAFSHFLFKNTKYFGLQKSFYADEKCQSCGNCERICLSNQITLVEGKPVWNQNIQCTYCFACISYCPTQAIQAKGKRTKKKGRYHHPGITLKEIAKQKI
ncbi:MAG: EFR1 family ferrodoxin [Candidatus Thorarchaeota archaeon]